MSIDHNGFAFGFPKHGALMESPFDQSVAIQQFFGLSGEVHLIGLNEGRELTIEIALYNAADELTLRSATNAIALHQGVNATLDVNGITYPLCTFIGFKPKEAPFLDGSGKNGWMVRGTLVFRQIAS